MAGGFDRKPGGTSRVQDASAAGGAVPGPGKHTLTERLGHAAPPRFVTSPSRATASQSVTGIAARSAGAQGSLGVAASGAVGPAPPAGAGDPLPPEVRVRMERALGADFSAVRTHVGPHVAALGARAFTRGTDIHFAPGEYDPHSARGQELLGHELAHVVQQSQLAVPATGHTAGTAVNDDPGLERAADDAGARAARGEPAPDQRHEPAAPHRAAPGRVAPLPAAPGGGVVQRQLAPGSAVKVLKPGASQGRVGRISHAIDGGKWAVAWDGDHGARFTTNELEELEQSAGEVTPPGAVDGLTIQAQMTIAGYAVTTPAHNALHFDSRMMGTGRVQIQSQHGIPHGYQLAIVQNALAECAITAEYTQGAEQTGTLGKQYLDAGPYNPYMAAPTVIPSGGHINAVDLMVYFRDAPHCSLQWKTQEVGDLERATASRVFQTWLVLIKPDQTLHVIDNIVWVMEWEVEDQSGVFAAKGDCFAVGKNNTRPIVITGTLANDAPFVWA